MPRSRGTKIVNRSDFHETATMAHAWAYVGKFSSVKEAKRAGWTAPLAPGTHTSGSTVLVVME